MQLIFWLVVFFISLIVLIKAADYFTSSSEKIGLALRISPFIIGITIVSIGTSLPELATSIVAIFRGQTEIAIANAVGSNVANILLIIGLSTLVARVIFVERSLIDMDLPLLAAATALLVIVTWDRQVTSSEGIILFAGYLTYLAYTVVSRKREKKKVREEVEEETKELKEELVKKDGTKRRVKLSLNVFIILIASAIFIYFGAEYTIQSIIKIAEILNINPSVVAMTAVALGTSLPELVVSIRAALNKKFEIAIGNVLGSNIFNILMVVSIPSFFKTLSVDIPTFTIGIPFLIGVTILFIFSGISKKIHNWEGIFYLLIYVLFIAKLFNLF